LYIQTFGTVPPADIWHNNKTRFTDINFRRVNVGRYWLLPKPADMSRVVIWLMLIVTVSLFILQASKATIVLAIIVDFIGLMIASIYKRRNDDNYHDNKRTKDGDSGCGGDADGDNNTGHSGHSSHGDHGDSHGCSGHSGCGSGCSGCSSSGCSGCGGGGD
jgi:hypothetical protein